MVARSNPMFDKFHEECGVVAIYGHPEAAKLAYLGLYALQHRGQESAGIAASDGLASGASGQSACHPCQYERYNRSSSGESITARSNRKAWLASRSNDGVSVHEFPYAPR